jgi:hypothetical protein
MIGYESSLLYCMIYCCYALCTYLFGKGAFGFYDVPWYYVRSGSYVPVVAVLLQICVSSSASCLSSW